MTTINILARLLTHLKVLFFLLFFSSTENVGFQCAHVSVYRVRDLNQHGTSNRFLVISIKTDKELSPHRYTAARSDTNCAVQYYLIITLFLGSIEIDCVKSETML